MIMQIEGANGERHVNHYKSMNKNLVPTKHLSGNTNTYL